MRAVQVVGYHEPVRVADVPEPKIEAPDDVIVRVAGAGICRTDLHILRGELAEAFKPELPYTLGHENAGWVHEVGPAVAHLTPGDPVIVHPAVTCGHCRGCRAGDDMHCAGWRFPGVDGWDGGYAEYLRTTARALVKLPGKTEPATLAPHADAGLTAIHAVKRLAPFTKPGDHVVLVGFGGLGHLAIQLLREYTSAEVTVVDTSEERLEWAREFEPDNVATSLDGLEADVLLDLVGEGDVPQQALTTLRKGGLYSIVGYGGGMRVEFLDMINRELTVQGNQIGSHADLVDLVELVERGRIKLTTRCYPLDDVRQALADVAAGEVLGRAVLLP